MLLFITIVFLLYTIVFLLFPTLEIDGNSMYPTFDDGEKTRCSRIFSRKNLQVGDVYVYTRRAEDTGKKYLVVKRLQNIGTYEGTTYCFFLGDNLDNSLDSRHYGWIKSKQIIAKVKHRERRY